MGCIKMGAQIYVSPTVTGPLTLFEFNKVPRFERRFSDDAMRRGEPPN